MKESTGSDYINTLVSALTASLVTIPGSAMMDLEKRTGKEPDERFYESLLSFSLQREARLRWAWKFYLIATIVNYVALLSMVIAAVISLAFIGSSFITVLFGGASAGTLIVTLIWKPHSKLMLVQHELDRMSALASCTSILENALHKIKDPERRAKHATNALHQIKAIFDSRNKDTERSG